MGLAQNQTHRVTPAYEVSRGPIRTRSFPGPESHELQECFFLRSLRVLLSFRSLEDALWVIPKRKRVVVHSGHAFARSWRHHISGHCWSSSSRTSPKRTSFSSHILRLIRIHSSRTEKPS